MNNTTLQPDFAKFPDGLVPVIVQDENTAAVLMLGYMNQTAFDMTCSTRKATFFSRSKQRIWVKGETSGHFLHVRHLLLDCDQDAILLKVKPDGPTCHTGTDTCWGERNTPLSFLQALEHVVWERKNNPSSSSYTSSLFAEGLPKMAQKVGEEAVETIIEALGNDQERLLNESADLLFHLLVLLAAKEVHLADVEAVLRARHN
jgi:phosphoribosyl-AMP cyclohydrolase / phosphoribosyl-ATP pyrophosphohydrolase